MPSTTGQKNTLPTHARRRASVTSDSYNRSDACCNCMPVPNAPPPCRPRFQPPGSERNARHRWRASPMMNQKPRGAIARR
eukprot:1155127-Lingulodinium_polyedra.AAC.1